MTPISKSAGQGSCARPDIENREPTRKRQLIEGLSVLRPQTPIDDMKCQSRTIKKTADLAPFLN